MDTTLLLKMGKTFAVGTLLTTLGFTILYVVGILIIDKNEWVELLVIFSLWSVLIAIFMFYFDVIKKNSVAVYKTLGLAALLILTMVIDGLMRMPDNPLSLLFFVTFWTGVAYVIMPSFIKKYRVYILGVYALVLLYFTYVRLFSVSWEYYLNHEKAMALSFFVIPIPVFLLLWGYEQWRWLKNLKADKSAAELALLKTQINPHFFFNTLNNLYSLTVSQSKDAPDVILKLSEIMRYTIYEGKKDLVPIESEIIFLENYIELHKIRYHKKVDILFEKKLSGTPQIPPLLLIFLLENAFKHGVEKLQTNAYIHSKLITSEKEIIYEIENNFDPDNVDSKYTGIGLENLKKRLDLIYQEAYSLKIEKSTSVYSAKLHIQLV